MGLFNKNIQEMESSGKLNELRDKWFGSPKECYELDGAESQNKFPVDDFIPLTILAGGIIAAAVILATINRIIWGAQGERFKKSWKKISTKISGDHESVGMS